MSTVVAPPSSTAVSGATSATSATFATITSAHPFVPSTPAESCEVCGHPLTGHDPIAQRYCNATVSNALTRGCICSTQAV